MLHKADKSVDGRDEEVDRNHKCGVFGDRNSSCINEKSARDKNDYVENMGVVLNMSTVYPLELVILLGVFIISVLPTVIWTFVMSRKDSIQD